MNKRRNTLLFAALIVIAALAGFAVQRCARPEGAYVSVNSHGREIARLPLKKDAELVVGDEGQGRNRILVRDGAVSVEEADCPDQICVREGKKRRAGETIACLPHELILVVRAGDGGAAGDGADGGDVDGAAGDGADDGVDGAAGDGAGDGGVDSVAW